MLADGLADSENKGIGGCPSQRLIYELDCRKSVEMRRGHHGRVLMTNF